MNAIIPLDFKDYIVKMGIGGLGTGGQVVLRFPNNYGASVVRHEFSYGHAEGKFELAVARFTGPGNEDWELCYTTPITNDVLGWLDPEDVRSTLAQIMALDDREYIYIEPADLADNSEE